MSPADTRRKLLEWREQVEEFDRWENVILMALRSFLSRTYHAALTPRLIGLFPAIRYQLPGSKLRSVKIDSVSVWIRKGTPDLSVAVTSLKGEFDILRYILPPGYSGTIVDGGGYIGTAAIALHRLYPEASVISIEPSRSNFEILKLNTAIYPKIEVIHGALIGSDDLTIQLFDPGKREWGFTTTKTHSGSEFAPLVETVKTIRLHEIISTYGEIGILKLDIEGGELDLFQNAQEDLAAVEAVIVELHDLFVPGCREAFWASAKDRVVVKDSGEKFLSIRKHQMVESWAKKL